jgi:hypothetical protein
MTTKVTTVINSVKTTLQETEVQGVRWTNDEIISYLNDACRFLSENEPDAFADNSEFYCVLGTRQEIPENATRLIDVVRNLEGRKTPLTTIDKGTLNAVRPSWHSENPSNQQELFFSDDRDPKRFYVYPPAKAGSLLEIVCALEPRHHFIAEAQDQSSMMQVNDRYIPAIMNFILYRAFDKDSDTAGNFSRAQTYLRNAYTSLGIKMQNTGRISPNNEANK